MWEKARAEPEARSTRCLDARERTVPRALRRLACAAIRSDDIKRRRDKLMHEWALTLELSGGQQRKGQRERAQTPPAVGRPLERPVRAHCSRASTEDEDKKTNGCERQRDIALDLQGRAGAREIPPDADNERSRPKGVRPMRTRPRKWNRCARGNDEPQEMTIRRAGGSRFAHEARLARAATRE